MLKIGDKVVCINYFNQNNRIFLENRTYIVMFIHEQYKRKLVAIGPLDYQRWLNEKKGLPGEHYWFVYDSRWVDNDSVLFDNYFISVAECRRRKIEKINEV